VLKRRSLNSRTDIISAMAGAQATAETGPSGIASALFPKMLMICPLAYYILLIYICAILVIPAKGGRNE